jgi:hypothetical protein
MISPAVTTSGSAHSPLQARLVNPPLTVLPRRAASFEPQRSPGAPKVLQSSRAPAQLSLFERPRGGR